MRDTRKAIDEFSMVNAGDRWLVCLSGGKDSYTLLALLLDLKWRGFLDVELLACNLDQVQPGFPTDVLPNFFEKHGVDYLIERQDTYSIVTEKIKPGGTYCSLCSRLRRGILYNIARRKGCTSIVLGHHREDVLETFFLNLFHGGRISAMPPKLLNQDGDVFVLRPMVFCAERDIGKFSDGMKFPIIPCNLCGSQEGLQREKIKEMISGWETEQPGRSQVMLKALTNIRPTQLLDGKLQDFDNLVASVSE